MTVEEGQQFLSKHESSFDQEFEGIKNVKESRKENQENLKQENIQQQGTVIYPSNIDIQQQRENIDIQQQRENIGSQDNLQIQPHQHSEPIQSHQHSEPIQPHQSTAHQVYPIYNGDNPVEHFPTAATTPQEGDPSNHQVNIAALMAMEAIKESMMMGHEDQKEDHIVETGMHEQQPHSTSAPTMNLFTSAVAANGAVEDGNGPVAVPIMTTNGSSARSSVPLISKANEIIYAFKDGQYQCPREGCGKLYRNRNGLKYHIEKGMCSGSFDIVGRDGKLVGLATPDQSNQGSPKPPPRLHASDFENDPEAYARYKPFWCRKCSKRYKNINGLKYHAKAEHAEYSFHDIKGQILGA